MELYYLKSRYYDSKTGRFLNMDAEIEMLRNENNYNLYAYCNNNWVNYEDGFGNVKCKLFTIKEFEKETKNIKDDIEKYYKEKEKISADIYCSDDVSSYKDKWNNLSGYDYVIFNTHGGAKSICTNNKNIGELKRRITSYDVAFLKNYIEIKMVILLGYNNGHYDENYRNVNMGA